MPSKRFMIQTSNDGSAFIETQTERTGFLSGVFVTRKTVGCQLESAKVLD